MNSFHGTMNSFHGGMNSGTRWNEFIPGGMNSSYSRNPYTDIGEFRENINIEYQHWEFTSHNTWLCFKLLMMSQKKGNNKQN